MLESVRRKSLLSAFFGQHLRSVTPGNIKIRVVRIADTALCVFFQLVCGTFLKNSPDRCSYFLDQLRRDNLFRSIISLLKYTYHSIIIKYIVYHLRLNGRINLFFYKYCLYQILSKFTGFLPLLFSVLPSALSCDSSVISEETENLYIIHDTIENRSSHVGQINSMLLKSLIPK